MGTSHAVAVLLTPRSIDIPNTKEPTLPSAPPVSQNTSSSPPSGLPGHSPCPLSRVLMSLIHLSAPFGLPLSVFMETGEGGETGYADAALDVGDSKQCW